MTVTSHEIALVENAGVNELLDELFQRGVIGLETKKRIENLQSTTERSRNLISLLQNSVRYCPDQTLKILLDMLVMHDYCVKGDRVLSYLHFKNCSVECQMPWTRS